MWTSPEFTAQRYNIFQSIFNSTYRIRFRLQDGNHDAKYFLLYYYYGGMIYTAMKNYERALYFFEVAVSTPALAMSHIMLESYKKYILISLILHGKVCNFYGFNVCHGAEVFLSDCTNPEVLLASDIQVYEAA